MTDQQEASPSPNSTPNSPADQTIFDPQFGQSLDLVKENIKTLKRLFPDIVREGKIDFDRLREILGEEIDTEEEPYSFTWHGKRAALRLAQTPSMGTLRPCKEESVDWEHTQNLMIEGDNLEVLKLLQKSYYGKIKMIYIDPPYNTGNDFVYRDDYKDPLAHYLEETGQIDEAGRKTSTNTNTSGRYHTNWLNMIYPRLRLARNLLRDDGVIFISIDDNEQANLKKLCDEVFGSENFIADFIRKTKYTANDAKTGVNYQHEFLLCYAKNSENVTLLGGEKDLSKYKNPDNDPNGPWAQSPPHAKSGNMKTGYFAVVNPYTGKTDYPPKGTFWRFSQNTIQKHIDSGRLCFKKDHKDDERGFIFKRYLKDLATTQKMFDSLAFVDNAYMNQAATEELKELDLVENFAYPKGVEFLKKIIEHSTNEDSIILDFFAGSGTTGHAVMRFNAEHEAKSEESSEESLGVGKKGARFILVQLPEACAEKSEAYQAGYRTIADICKERLRRAGRKIQEENPHQSLDVGFRVFKLDSSNIKPWDPTFKTLEEDLIANVDNIKHDRSSDDLLFELLLKYGLDLSLPIETHVFAGKKVYVLGGGALMVCLDKDVSMQTIEGIGQLKETLSPDIIRVVFRDHCFENDVIKTNALLTLKQRYAITDIKSL